VLNFDELLRRISAWNHDRDCNEFDPVLESRMLIEEYHEVLTAPTCADILQEYADMLFVFQGTKYKLYQSDYYPNLLEEFHLIINAADGYIRHAMHIIDERFLEYYGLEELPEDINELHLASLDAVITANELKPTERVNGKIVKGDKYVSPRAKIEELVEAWERKHGLN
jgi:hypothetical protein